MGYPRRLLTDGEVVVREFRPHWRLLVIPLLWAIVFIAVIVVTWLYRPEVPAFDWGVTALAIIALIYFAVYRFIQWFFTWYILTDERLITRSGVLARRGLEIPLENINDVQFSQNILERVLRSGDLLVESAGEQGQSRFSDIPDPEAFQSLIYRIREDRSRSISGGPEGSGAPQGDSAVGDLERLAGLHERGFITREEFDERKNAILGETPPAPEPPGPDA